MDKERQKKGPPAANASGQMWRAGKQNANHAKDVLEQHKKALQSGLKPAMPSAARAKQDVSAIHQKVNATANSNSGNPFTNGIKPPSKASATASNNLAKAMQMQAAEEAMGVGGTRVAATNGNEGSNDAYPEVN